MRAGPGVLRSGGRPSRRCAAEAVRAREPAAAGHLARLWRPVGELRGIGVRRAADEQELHEKVLGTLPLRPWTTLTVTAPEPSPQRPRQNRRVTRFEGLVHPVGAGHRAGVQRWTDAVRGGPDS
ncbi:muconolactone Delta-isomerase family protein [Streptomyces puniciscabiei]